MNNNKKTKKKARKEKPAKQFPTTDKLLKSISALIDEVDKLHNANLKLEGDKALLEKIEELQQKLSSLLQIQPAELALQNKTAIENQTKQIRDEQKEKEVRASNFLNLDSWYRDRSSLPEQKLVQYVGEENSESGSAKRYRFRDGGSGVSFTLDANSVLNRMEQAV
jgi:hypothetical protein